MDPTYEQINDVLLVLDNIDENLVEAVGHLIFICKVNLSGLGLMIGSQLWRNFILAKNQRTFW